ncbi:MAG: SusC/RagA family TonB-linked outer membrane protein, partial [Cyclobacteriaceae bacterium]
MTIIAIVVSTLASAQQRKLTGTVVDSETGEGLPGVTIQEVGTSNGTVTDIEGNYSLVVSPSAKEITYSFIGFESQTIGLSTQTKIDVSLQPDVQALEEVVVVGYGTSTRSKVTGSVVSVSGDDLKKVPVSTVAESLTGRLAGVQITTTEGSPDAEINIRVRGGASLTQNSSPLFIVDGFPVSTISDLAPSDIQSIDVLKDASSTAIYGSRGANGVVIVTTKSGTKGKVKVSFNSFYASKRIAKTLDVLDPGDYAKWQYEYAVLDARNEGDYSSYENFFGLFEDIDLYQGQPANDWQRQIYGRTGVTQSNDLSIRGGSDKFNYSVNFARFSEDAIMIGSDYVRNNVTLKFMNRPNDKLELNFSLRYSDTQINGGGANEQNEVSSADSRLKHAVAFSPIPIAGLSSPDDTNEQIASDLVNPIVSTNDNQRLQERSNYNISGGVSWMITDALKVSSSFTIDNYNFIDNRFYGVTTYKARDRSPNFPNQPSVLFRDRKETRLRNTNLITYDVLKGSSHYLNIMAGHELLFSETNQFESEVQGFPVLFNSDEAFKLSSQGTAIYTDINFSPDDKLVSFFGRANYDFKERYLVSAVYRADGSSRFRGSNAWGFFPSLSAGWKISEESFMSGVSSWMYLLKLRASYGVAGNNNIPRGQTAQFFESRTTNFINNVNSYWAASNTLANPDLRWETTETKNIGLDFGLFEGRLNGTLEAYLNNTTDLLIEFPISGVGYNSQFRNMGETENKGVELSLTGVVLDKKDYGLSINANIAFNRNNIVSLGDVSELTGTEVNSGWASTQIAQDFLTRAGNPIGLMYGYVNDGRYEVDDFEGYDESTGQWILKEGVVTSDILTVRPGMMKLIDLDGNDTINSLDR